jgi:hypothetical protein
MGITEATDITTYNLKHSTGLSILSTCEATSESRVANTNLAPIYNTSIKAMRVSLSCARVKKPERRLKSDLFGQFF